MIPAGPTKTPNTPHKPHFSGAYTKKCIRNSNLFTIYFLKYFYYLMFGGYGYLVLGSVVGNGV